MDTEAYIGQMIEYYDRRVDPQTIESTDEYARMYDQMLQDIPWYAAMAQRMQTLFAGRRVLELAAGDGRWARHLAPVVDHILGVDMVPRLKSRWPQVVEAGRDLPPGRVEFAQLDAHCPHLAPGTFDAALVVNWFQHMPIQRHAEFIDGLRRKVEPGGIVFLAINHYGPAVYAGLFSKPGDPNRYGTRQAFDGKEHDIIDNVFSQADLREIFGPVARDLRFELAEKFFWIEFEMA
ncbi:MAG: methyltransferase domain-containing protein [Candidatus Latescibacteria bacterium]|nr:methyltransferase domain-containing protein [Candidatus Latescibacterota bacterium]